MQDLRSRLTEIVQRNCHIADARHGGDYGLCTYLMKMREYFRWEKRLPFTARLPQEEIGDWLTQRERLWASLEDADFSPLEIAGRSYGPFDADSINLALRPYGLVYGGGLGQRARPHFFFGAREHSQDGAVLMCGEEYARDLAAPPAMLRGDLVYIRRESLRRMLWEKLEIWRWSRPRNALARAFAGYAFDTDLDAALEHMTGVETTTVLWHEIGEQEVERRLGESWNRMLLSLVGTPAELMARAARDHWADCWVTLPALAAQQREASLHFFMGNLGAMRQDLFPSLHSAYASWLEHGDFAVIQHLAEQGREHWAVLAQRLIEAWEASPETAPEGVRRLVEANRL
jgi:hypothetical protein